MKQVLDSLCDYRRYCWNEALEVWNTLYEQRLIGLTEKERSAIQELVKSKQPLTDELQELNALYPSPSYYTVRNILTSQKEDWQYLLSSRVLQLAVKDLSDSWFRFYENSKEFGKPTYKSSKAPKQGFKTDRSRIINGKLVLDKPQPYKETWYPISFRGANLSDGKITLCSITRVNGKYYASLVVEIELLNLTKTDKVNAVDLNVDHFDTLDGRFNLQSKLLNKLYNRVKHYQKVLARKRLENPDYKNSKGYQATRVKLQATYERIRNIQDDLLHKFTTSLFVNYDTVVLEDLDVRKMQMKKQAKNLHRSLFGRFRQYMEYKAIKFDKKLIIADRFYPSTQRCSSCGFVKTGEDKITLEGNKKHGTKHHEYVCYGCGFTTDRDYNAVLNLLALA
jgi:putative transposase